MKVEISEYKENRGTLTEFAEKNDLVMIIQGIPKGYTANFKKVESKEGMIFSSVFGEGATPRDAVIDYCRKIAGCHLVIDARQTSRIDLIVPAILECNWDGGVE